MLSRGSTPGRVLPNETGTGRSTLPEAMGAVWYDMPSDAEIRAGGEFAHRSTWRRTLAEAFPCLNRDSVIQTAWSCWVCQYFGIRTPRLNPVPFAVV